MKRFSLKKKLVAGGAALALVAGAGAAYAAWTGTGNGSGTAKAASAQSVTLNTVSPTGDLYPGGSGKVSFTVTNPNPYALTVTSVDDSAATIASSDETNCPNTLVTFTSTTFTGLTLAVGAGPTTSATLSIANAVTLDHSAGNLCQGVTFTISGLTAAYSQV